MNGVEHVRDALGAYVLGALEDDETARVEAHLGSCDECRAEHARLAPLPTLLDLLYPGEARAPATAPQHLEDAVLAGFTAERLRSERGRWRRWWPRWPRGRAAGAGALASAAATVVLLAAVGAFQTDSEARSVRLTPPDGSPASAEATLRPAGANTRVSLRVHGIGPTRAGELYEVWFVRGEGRVSAGTFTVEGSGEAELELTTAARATNYQRIGITREPDGLDPERNGPNVLAGPLS